MAAAPRSFSRCARIHHVEDAPFRLYCDQFIRASERSGERAISVMLDGGENCLAGLSLVRLPRRKLPKPSIMTAGGDAVRPHADVQGPDRLPRAGERAHHADLGMSMP